MLTIESGQKIYLQYIIFLQRQTLMLGLNKPCQQQTLKLNKVCQFQFWSYLHFKVGRCQNINYFLVMFIK